MRYIDKWKLFESTDTSDKTRSRSERLLSQAQVEYKDELKVNTNLPTMVFTDVEGSSKMWSDDPVKMMNQLEGHHSLVELTSEKYQGWIVKTIGDAFMVYFEPGPNSLLNALKFSKDLLLNEKRYNLRVGICQGPMEEKTYRIQKVDLRDFYGNAVNVASRMESKVSEKAGTIAFSTVNNLTQNQLSLISKTIGDIEKVDLQKYELRGASISTAYKIKIK